MKRHSLTGNCLSARKGGSFLYFAQYVTRYTFFMEIEEIKRQFLEYTEIERGRAVKTIENYDHYLTVFFQQMNVKKVEQDLGMEVAAEYERMKNIFKEYFSQP